MCLSFNKYNENKDAEINRGAGVKYGEPTNINHFSESMWETDVMNYSTFSKLCSCGLNFLTATSLYGLEFDVELHFS